MPLFGRKHVGFVSPPSELSPNEDVFVIEQTNEAFRDYEDYVRRIEFYELPCWTCKLTNQTNLTYFKALRSEEKARKGQPAMKRCFKRPILNIVHHSNDRFDDIVDDAHEHVQTIFAEGELVETKREGSDEAEEATVVKVIPPAEEDPDDPEPEPFFYDVEFKKDKSIRKNVNSDDISRLQRAPSKETIKLFVRDSTIRMGKPESMLWIVHKHLTEEFDIPDKLASDVQLPNLPVWPTVLPPKRLSVAGSGAPGPASLKEAKTKKEKAVSRVAKSLQRILDGVSGESKAKVEKGKNGPMKQATLHQFGLASPKPALPNPSARSKVEDDFDDVGSRLAVNPLPKWKPKSVFEQLCSSASHSNSKLYRNLLKSAAMTLTPSQMERLPSPERKKVERKKWVMMSEEEKQKVKEQRKEKAKREREEKKKVIPDEELLASADPLPDGVPILLPETLESSDFPDLVLVTEFLHHFQELLCPDETQQRAVSLESLATALTTGMDGFGVVSGVLVSLLQLLLTEVPTRHKLFSLPVRACPLSLYTVSDLLRIYFEQFRVSAEKPSRSPVDSDDSDDDGANSSGGEEKAKKEEPVGSDQEDEEEDKIDKDNIITPELLRLIDSLDQMEFCELNAREKLQIMVCLCHKTLYSDAVDDFLDEKKKKLQEIWKDDRAERAEERALLKKEREKRKEEGTSKKTSSSTTTNEKAPPASSSENQSVIKFSKEIETKDKESSLAIAEAENGKRRRVSVIEAQAIREQKERQMREKRDEEARLRRQELDKRKAESKKVARKDEAVQCRKVHRLEPLGCDRSFRRYWLFDSAFPGVYAEVGWALGEENRWVRFDSVERLERLVDSLSTRGQREKALKANLAEAVKVVQEQFQSYGSRISSRNREKDSIQALKDGLIALVKKLGRKRLITGEDQAKFERRIDSANGLVDLIPLVIDCQEAIGEVCLKGTLLPDETKSSSRQKEKENLLEQWRDAVLGAKTLSKVHLLVSVLDVSIRWEKGVKIVHQPKRRISLRRAAAAKTSYKEVEEVGDDEDDDEADNESGAAESSDSESNDDDGDDGETTDSSDTLSPDESAPPKRMTRASARATAGRKVVAKSSKRGRVLRSNTRGDTGTAVSSRTRRRIESENEDEDAEENDEDGGSDEEEFESRPGRRKRAKKSRPPADESRRTRRKRRHFDSEDSTSAVRRTRRADVDLRADMKVCEEIVGHLLSAKCCWPFLRPVSKKETPDYFDIITNPMDFGTIREKLDLAQYVSLKAFLSDVRLVFFNCDAYNQATSDVGLAGRELESLFIRYLDEKLPNAAYMPVFDVADVREGGDGHSKKRSRRGAKV